MFSPSFGVILSTFLLLTSAQSTTSRSEAISAAFLQCTNKPGSTCSDIYKVDSCIISIIPNFWEIFDAHHNSTDISTTPLGEALPHPKLKSCVCAQTKLQGLEECVECVRNEADLHTGEVDLFGVGFVAERVCGVVLPGFGLPQEGRDTPITVLDNFPKTNSTLKNETTTHPDITHPRNGTNNTDIPDPTPGGGKNDTSTPGRNQTVQTPTPTPTQPDADQPSASESQAAAVKLAAGARDIVGMVVAGPWSIAVVVGVGMVLL